MELKDNSRSASDANLAGKRAADVLIDADEHDPDPEDEPRLPDLVDDGQLLDVDQLNVELECCILGKLRCCATCASGPQAWRDVQLADAAGFHPFNSFLPPGDHVGALSTQLYLDW
eukprot:CAMPEP_0181218120 /NCGR_PEP_ID=MMETSP1096-20121128/27519_1 /TAXON_ID=156174 ORGANISM="Chrysochromulina ericina, Strain CCMP281" /NCGR_SAMPLE_ID=MMETSP1096 /ASSEMBLY_ACC=CAM_ASM_000453 /LENGTH=115 /DNA_ID=CAMNT_0023310305 /DNA_START=311 /DNA_END=655 /DNA_ORIENTATION=+